MGEKFGRDSIWESHLSAELWQTEVGIQAVLDQVEVPLGEILRWEPGSRLELNSTPKSVVDLRCGEISMFRGQMGRKAQNIAVQVTDKSVGEEDQFLS